MMNNIDQWCIAHDKIKEDGVVYMNDSDEKSHIPTDTHTHIHEMSGGK